ncbi:type 4 pilus major pilin [Metallibacterium scheffleri]|uniref:Type 4 secretion system PilS N-terminal domain-containing protein n=1 Tax=Metallibacterium scheffleri TaxID=993689 RepID=A0A4S3KQP9_9GAMM|nr:type 4 pilus major pilin [Metallibacterium scheffleri]THD11329.1 hypothetical protein B1806_04200 [Metallibacterium scheffleri]
MNVYRIRNPQKKRALGQISIEYVIVIALVALALVGIIIYATRGRHEQNVNAEASNLTTMVGAVQKQYNTDPNGFANVTAPTIIDNGDVPSQLVQGTTIVSGFGSPITVAPATTYAADDSVSFTYDVPPDECSNFVQAVASDFVTISVGGTDVKNVAGGVPTVSNATLGTQCSSTAGAQVPIIFTATR